MQCSSLPAASPWSRHSALPVAGETLHPQGVRWATRYARHSVPKPYPLLPPGHRALTSPGQPGRMVGASKEGPLIGTGFHVLLFYSCSSSLLGLGQNRSKLSCVQLPVGKGNMEPEKGNKS